MRPTTAVGNAHWVLICVVRVREGHFFSGVRHTQTSFPFDFKSSPRPPTSRVLRACVVAFSLLLYTRVCHSVAFLAAGGVAVEAKKESRKEDKLVLIRLFNEICRSHKSEGGSPGLSVV